MRVLSKLYIIYEIISFTLGYYGLKLFYGHDKIISLFSERLNFLGREYLSRANCDKTYKELKFELYILSQVYLKNFIFLKKDAALIESKFFELIDRKIRWEAKK